MDFNKALTNALNIQVPLQAKQITTCRTVPWFTDDVRELKKAKRRREAIWRKYKREDTWIAFKVVKSKYRSKLHRAKYWVIKYWIVIMTPVNYMH